MDHPKVSLARALSKLGYCSRTKAQPLIQAGHVRVNGLLHRDGETRVDLGRDQIEVDGRLLTSATRIYLMLNKPRGLVTTTSDERGRKTVYDCLGKGEFPWLSPVGRLDKASEGLLLFTNDTRWAGKILAPETHLEKTYHVRVDRFIDDDLRQRMMTGITAEEGDFLKAKRLDLLRRGSRHCWLEIVLDEGKNRHIRRLLSAFAVNVLRLVRVAIGPVQLGNLAKGDYRLLTERERRSLIKATTTPAKKNHRGARRERREKIESKI
jgi:23S rRNA pseudouridine2605 synthase